MHPRSAQSNNSQRVVSEPSGGVVVVVAVSVVLYFQRAIVQYINSPAGKQVRICQNLIFRPGRRRRELLGFGLLLGFGDAELVLGGLEEGYGGLRYFSHFFVVVLRKRRIDR